MTELLKTAVIKFFVKIIKLDLVAMPIQSQCEQCAKYVKGVYGMKCRQWNIKPDFNDQECDKFVKGKDDPKKKQEFETKKEKPVGQDEGLRLTSTQDCIKYASEQMIKFNVSDEYLKKDMLSKGASEDQLNTIIEQARVLYKAHNRYKGKKSILIGIVGILASFAYLWFSIVIMRGFLSILFYGIITWGIVEVIRGIVLIISNMGHK